MWFLFDFKCGFMFFGCENRSGKLWTCSHHDCKVATLDFNRNKSRGFFPVLCNTDHCQDIFFTGEFINNNDAIVQKKQSKDHQQQSKPLKATWRPVGSDDFEPKNMWNFSVF